MIAFSKGNAIASANSIDITHDYHEITGNTAITIINPPSPGFVGFIILKFTHNPPAHIKEDDSYGNITLLYDGSEVAPPINRPVLLFYDGSKWFPEGDWG